MLNNEISQIERILDELQTELDEKNNQWNLDFLIRFKQRQIE